MTPRYPPDPEHAFRDVPEDDKGMYWRWFSTGSVGLDFLRAYPSAKSKAATHQDLADSNLIIWDLGCWLLAADLVPYPAPVVSKSDMVEAQALSEVGGRLVAAHVQARRFDAKDLIALNKSAARSTPIPVLTKDGFNWAPSSVAAGLAVVARDLVELLGRSKSGHIRRCDACEAYFLDTSKSRRRRWCSMRSCGNASKVDAFNKRKREESS